MRNTLLSLFIAFFTPLPIMIIIFQINYPLFEYYMYAFWLNGRGNALRPDIGGWILIVATIALLAGGLLLAYSKETILSQTLVVLGGIFLQLLLTGIYVKTVW